MRLHAESPETGFSISMVSVPMGGPGIDSLQIMGVCNTHKGKGHYLTLWVGSLLQKQCNGDEIKIRNYRVFFTFTSTQNIPVFSQKYFCITNITQMC